MRSKKKKNKTKQYATCNRFIGNNDRQNPGMVLHLSGYFLSLLFLRKWGSV